MHLGGSRTRSLRPVCTCRRGSCGSQRAPTRPSAPVRTGPGARPPPAATARGRAASRILKHLGSTIIVNNTIDKSWSLVWQSHFSNLLSTHAWASDSSSDRVCRGLPTRCKTTALPRVYRRAAKSPGKKQQQHETRASRARTGALVRPAGHRCSSSPRGRVSRGCCTSDERTSATS